MRPIAIYVGWDQREPLAYHVLSQSILTRASLPVTIAPLRQETLRQAKLYWREPDAAASTEFSLTRFLVPYLSDYQGVSIFMDCDMLCRVDLSTILEPSMLGNHRISPDEAVWVAKHDYTPRAASKFLGQVQAAYPRKNWSSVMVFNNARCRALTLDYVNTASPADLHRFAWIEDWRIGTLDLAWNHLVGEYPPNGHAKILHFTEGGPWWLEFRDCDHAVDWRAELKAMLRGVV